MAEDLQRLNRYLGLHGMPQIDDPKSLVEAIAFLIDDEPEFKRVLNKCEPQWRREMYEALKPNLSFKVKPLDVYIAELAMDAAAKRLPTIGADGSLEEYKIPEVETCNTLGRGDDRYVYSERRADAPGARPKDGKEAEPGIPAEADRSV